MPFYKKFTGTSTAGRAADLGDTWFRSRWERNFARYLKYTHQPYEYEKKTFWFDAIKRGTTSYKPDFYCPQSGHYYEVKGYLDARSKTALKRMAKYYPAVMVIVIDRSWFQRVKQQGLPTLIPHWEVGATREPRR